MRYLSKKLTDYIIKVGVIQKELYAVYQYGFQIGLEMFTCFFTCFCIAIYLHMIPEFIVVTSSFMLLRTYAGGLHLNNFVSCFICSVIVQTLVLLSSRQVNIILPVVVGTILCGSILILKAAPVENINKELSEDEKKHCKNVTMKILIGIVVFSANCIFFNLDNMLFLMAMIILVVLVSQYLGMIKYRIEKIKSK